MSEDQTPMLTDSDDDDSEDEDEPGYNTHEQCGDDKMP